MRHQPLHCLILRAPIDARGAIAADQSKLRASTAKPRQPSERPAKRASAASQRPDDPVAAAKARGAFIVAEATSKPPATVRARPQQPRGPPALAAYSIPEFCVAHSISESFFYKLQREDRGPAVMKVGARTLISAEAAEQWRRDREAKTANNETSPPP